MRRLPTTSLMLSQPRFKDWHVSREWSRMVRSVIRSAIRALAARTYLLQNCPADYTDDGVTCRKGAHIFGKASYGWGGGFLYDLRCESGSARWLVLSPLHPVSLRRGAGLLGTLQGGLCRSWLHSNICRTVDHLGSAWGATTATCRCSSLWPNLSR